MHGLRFLSWFVLLIMGALLSVMACANNNAKLTSCDAVSQVYFDCHAAGKAFMLCGQPNKSILFFEKSDSSTVSLSGYIGKEFKFENYHRFKVVQNTLSFSIEKINYEIFDYVDEESKPAIREAGLIISSNGDKKEVMCSAGYKSQLGLFNNK